MKKMIANNTLIVDRLIDDISKKSSAFSLDYVDMGLDCTNEGVDEECNGCYEDASHFTEEYKVYIDNLKSYIREISEAMVEKDNGFFSK